MGGNIIGIVIGIVFCVLAAVAWGRIISGRFRQGALRAKKVKATAINKQTFVVENFSMKVPSNKRRFVVTFLAEGREKSFDVSPETYDRIRLKQTGVLIYQGSRFYDFG